MRELIAATALAVLMFTLANSGHAAGTHTHTSKPFAGVKANTGTVRHSKEGGRSVLTLSDDFKVPDTLLGTVEIAVAAMIALRPVSPRIAAVGSGMAVMMFLTTLSFLLSTPGWEASLGGFPALSVVPGQFLLKDVALLGAAVWSLGEALTAEGA